MKRTNLIFAALLCSIIIKAQSLEINYLSGVSTSMFSSLGGYYTYDLEIKNRLFAYPNFVGEASVGYNFYKEKLKVTLGYNQLNYAYGYDTYYIFPYYRAVKFTGGSFSAAYTHAVSTTFGPNIKIRPKIFFHPFAALYLTFNRGVSSSGSGVNIEIPNEDGTKSYGKVRTEDLINFRSSFIIGVGFKFNFFVTKWLYLTVGSRYNRGFRKDIVATHSIEIDGQRFETRKYIRSSNFSVDLGLGVKLNLKKKKKGQP